MIKRLFFDLGSTLIDESECAEYRTRELLRQRGAPCREVLERRMAELAALYDVPVCLMHNRNNTEYDDFVNDVAADLKKCLAVAKKYNIKPENILLDPGIGFGKTYEQNLILLDHLETVCELGYPVLLGASRKSVIGLTLELPVTEREEGTIATTVLGAMKGCSFVRVHDVRANARALQMTEAVRRAGRQYRTERGNL